MAPVSLNDFKKQGQTAAYWKARCQTSIKTAVGKTDEHFVAVKNYQMGTTFGSLFVVVDSSAIAEAIKSHLKTVKQGTPLAVSSGTADVLQPDKGKFKVVVKKAVGALSANIISSSVLLPAVGKDTNFIATTPEREQAEADSQRPSVARSPSTIAKASLNQALKDGAAARLKGKNDPDLMKKPGIHQLQNEMPADAYLDMLGKNRAQIEEFMKFARAYQKLATEYKFDDNSLTIPGQIWLSLIKSMKSSGYVKGLIPEGADGRYLLRVDGPDGKKVREALLEKGMVGMQAFINHAAANLDKVVKAVEANGSKTWAFWSGIGAKDAARKEAGGGLVLEGSIGSWFDNIWAFNHLTGVDDMVLWSAMSELYAKKAAEYYQTFSFIGFMGPGSTKETTVWTNIEQPTLIQVLDVQKRVPVPKVRWYVVDCVHSPAANRGAGGWVGTGNASKEFSNRGAAEAEVKKRYTE